jgi:hypothetical protein
MFVLLWKVSRTGHGQDEVDYRTIDRASLMRATEEAKGIVESLHPKVGGPYPKHYDFLLLGVVEAIKIPSPSDSSS